MQQENRHSLQKNKRAYQKGFTLLETVVALAIVVTAVIGPLAFSSQSIASARYARAKIVALNLAQEGIEIIRGYRENNMLATGDRTQWLNDIIKESITRVDFRCPSGAPCSANQAKNAGYKVCDTLTECRLNFNESTGLYGHQTGIGWIASPFTRTMQVLEHSHSGYSCEKTEIAVPVTNYPVDVLSKVTWNESSGEKEVVLHECLYPWD